jgi:hypothetical protein
MAIRGEAVASARETSRPLRVDVPGDRVERRDAGIDVATDVRGALRGGR